MQVDKDIVDSITHIVEYLYEDEARHFEEGGKKRPHIFDDIKTVAGWAWTAKGQPLRELRGKDKISPVLHKVSVPRGGWYGEHVQQTEKESGIKI